jgi:hypothetical protein
MFICTSHSRGVGNASRNDRLIENSIQCNVTGILDVLVRYGRLIGPSSINQHFRIHDMDDRMVPRDGSPWFPVDPGDSEEDFDFTLKPISFFMEQIWWSDARVSVVQPPSPDRVYGQGREQRKRFGRALCPVFWLHRSCVV